MSTVRGTSTVRIRVMGVEGIRRALRPLLDPELTNTIDAANRAQARELAKQVKAEAKPLSKRMARAVRVKRAKTGKPGWIVGSRRKVAFFFPFVVGGTKAHGPRKAQYLTFRAKDGRFVTVKRVRGVSAHPIVEKVADRYGERALSNIEDEVVRKAGL